MKQASSTSSSSSSSIPKNEQAIDTIFSSSSSETNDLNKNNGNNVGGAWIGIDLGTTNCACAAWDTKKQRAKLFRLGYHDLATPITSSGSSKGGRIIPSKIVFQQNGDGDSSSNTNENIDSIVKNANVNAIVGHAAEIMVESAYAASSPKGIKNNKTGQEHYSPEEVSDALVSSMKRVLGMSVEEAKSLAKEHEDQDGQDFLRSLPFKSVIAESSDDVVVAKVTNGETNGKKKQEKDVALTQEGIMARVKPLKSVSTIDLKPMEAAAILLQSIRVASEHHLSTGKLHAPGYKPNQNQRVRNCVIGVPAHYGRAQRNIVKQAAKWAGFDGHVSTITESTAAVLAYGLFVSPDVTLEEEKEGGTRTRPKSVLVFDMGGGTTDVTIATCSSQDQSDVNHDGDNDDKVHFRVRATAGDRTLGGDDMDELLVRFFLDSTNLSESLSHNEHWELRQSCKLAKEQLCGGDQDDTKPLPETTISFQGKDVNLTQETFRQLIIPLVTRAEMVVESAMNSFLDQENEEEGDGIVIDEVVLVGGASRVPSIQEMLSARFPPPTPPSLCYSLGAYSAVAQGAAIQSAINSKLVPKHELRNAMMLDALPHDLGIQVFGEGGKEEFVPVLNKNSSLPSSGHVTLSLADLNQKGVSIKVMEHVGDGEPLQHVGDFSFLLHQLTMQEQKRLMDGKRTVDVGITINQDGKLIVSIFDWNDPECLDKKKRYQEQKKTQGNDHGDEFTVEENEEEDETLKDIAATPMEQIMLTIGCVVLFLFYLAVRYVFHEPEESARII